MIVSNGQSPLLLIEILPAVTVARSATSRGGVPALPGDSIVMTLRVRHPVIHVAAPSCLLPRHAGTLGRDQRQHHLLFLLLDLTKLLRIDTCGTRSASISVTIAAASSANAPARSRTRHGRQVLFHLGNIGRRIVQRRLPSHHGGSRYDPRVLATSREMISQASLADDLSGVEAIVVVLVLVVVALLAAGSFSSLGDWSRRARPVIEISHHGEVMPRLFGVVPDNLHRSVLGGVVLEPIELARGVPRPRLLAGRHFGGQRHAV
mmetsp:Transcript_29389/g.70940  ORF Transcript_29389/g.70940 Transcript_29389/m.70940 type:complete len:263 (+) Transcript_29389:436-1224(+)